MPTHSRIEWRPSYRIVSSRFPPVGLFDAIAAPEDLEVLFLLESLTNPRLRDDLGQIALVPAERRCCGPGTTPIMAAFTHLNPEGSRFTNGSYGVYYAALDCETAVAETAFHRARFLSRTAEPPCIVEMRCYLGDIAAELDDIRDGFPNIHDPDSYVASQRFAWELREQGSDGLVYDSVRHTGGQCVALFYPDLIAPVRQGPHLYYHWDGREITHAVVTSDIIIPTRH